MVGGRGFEIGAFFGGGLLCRFGGLYRSSCEEVFDGFKGVIAAVMPGSPLDTCESITEFVSGMYMRYVPEEWSIEHPKFNCLFIQLSHFCPNSDVSDASKLLQILVRSM